MTRAEKVAEAQRLHTAGLLDREIAERLGVHKSTVWRYRHPEAVKEYYRRDDPDRERRRAWERSDRGRQRCPSCGGLKGVGSAGSPRLREGICRSCRQAVDAARVATRAHQIERLWAEGLTARQIGERFGWTKTQTGVEIAHLRRKGFDIPHRRTPEQVARIKAGWAKARAA